MLRMGRAVRVGELCGVFRGSEAVASGGLTHGQLRGPGFVRLFRDVYLPAGIPVTHEIRCQGAALAFPGEAVITGRSAATLRGVVLARPWDPIELVVPLRSRIARRQGLDVRRTDLETTEWREWHGIGLATPERTALDVLLDRSLPDAVADLDVLLGSGLAERCALQAALAPRRDRGIVRARQAVGLADPRAGSPPESKVRVWLRLAGMTPEPQYRVCDGHGGQVGIVDLAFPEARLAVEYDGRWHGEWLQVGPDRERLNRLHAAGWDVVFVTAEMLRSPKRMVQTVRAALAVRPRR